MGLYESVRERIMMLFSLGFPLFFIMMGVGFAVGALAVIIILGTLSFVVGLALIYAGVIRISPIFDFAERLIDLFLPGVKEKVADNIRKSLTVEGSPREGKKLFLFHPHGMFSTSHFFHIGTTLTSWPVRNVRPTAIYWGNYVPFGREIYERFGAVSSDYASMKKVLKGDGGDSLAVTLGGVREMLHIIPGVMKICIAKKYGIFRMAIETGVPLVPVLCYGENEQFQLAEIWGLKWLHKWLATHGHCIPIPSLSSWRRWAQLFSTGLETPVHSVIGDEVKVGEKREATDKEIIELREKYISAIKELYKKTRPSWYKDELVII